MHALEFDLERARGRPLLVGLSGGLDSTVLLHHLAAAPGLRAAGLRALHVHHGLHADADRWAAHCRQACAALDVPLQVVPVAVARDAGDGPEAAARHARHAAFEAALRDGEVLVLAHHLDDQAETFLLRALRGSGSDGLGAMRPWRRFGRGWLWRPLLGVPRAVLLAHAQRHDLAWIEDPGNADTALDRNFLRREVLPLLRGRWPQAAASFARSAALCADAAGLLDIGDEQALATARTADPWSLDYGALARLPAPRRARVLRRWIAALGLPPLPAAGVVALEADLLGPASDRGARFDWSGATIRRWRDLLHAGPQRPALPAEWQAHWDGDAPLPLPTGGQLFLESSAAPGPAAPGIDVPAVEGFGRSLVVRARRGGERIVLPGRAHSHALKHVLQDLGVPPWRRESLPLLSDPDGTLLAAGDLVLSAGFHAWLGARGARLVWATPGPPVESCVPAHPDRGDGPTARG